MPKFDLTGFHLVFVVLAAVFFVGCGGDSEPAATEIDRSAAAPMLGGGNSDSSSSTSNRSEVSSNSRETPEPPSQPDGSGTNSSSNSAESATARSTSGGNGLFPDFGDTAAGASKDDSMFGGALFPRSGDEVAQSNTQQGSFAEFNRGRRGGTSAAGGTASSAENFESDADPFDFNGEESTDTSEMSISTSSTPSVSLMLDAKKLFQKHDEQAAINYVYANHLISDESRDTYQLGWYPGLKEPRLFFRWGVGVIFSPKKIEGRHPVIGDPGDPDEGVSRSDRGGRGGNDGGLGTPGTPGRGGAAGGGGRSGSRTYKNVDTSRPDGCLLYYTGDFGERFITLLEARRTDKGSPYYGQVLKDVMEVEDPNANPEADNVNQRNRRRGNTGTASFGGGNGGARRNTRNTQGDEPSILDRALGSSTAQRPEDDFSGTIIPGVELLGRGSKSDLIERARAAEVDALVLFNVKISKSRGSRNRRGGASTPTFTNTTSMRIVDVKTGENLFSSKSLKDTSVEEAVDDGEDPVDDEIKKAFSSFADKNFKVQEMPSGLNEKNVKGRIGSLLKSKEDINPLRSAVEIVSFHKAQLLSEELAITALKRLFGDSASSVLVSGSESERLNFLRDKLPEGAGE